MITILITQREISRKKKKEVADFSGIFVESWSYLQMTFYARYAWKNYAIQCWHTAAKGLFVVSVSASGKNNFVILSKIFDF